MATTPDTDEANVASHTLAYLRSLDRKLDLVVDALQRHGERLGRLERDLGEVRRDIAEVKGDMALLDNKLITAQTDILEVKSDIAEVKNDIASLDNKMTTAQTEILAILHRLDQRGNGARPRQ